MTKKSTRRRSRPAKNMLFPFTFMWGNGETIYTSTVLPVPCQFCKALAIVLLPAAMLAKQTDGTTHVCHPSAGGCNHGFAANETTA